MNKKVSKISVITTLYKGNKYIEQLQKMIEKNAEILRKQRRDCYIIFVTNHNELVYGSMEFQPFYFIQKSSVSRLNKDVVNVLNKLSVY